MLILNNCRHNVKEDLQRIGIIDLLSTGQIWSMKQEFDNFLCLTTGLNLKENIEEKRNNGLVRYWLKKSMKHGFVNC